MKNLLHSISLFASVAVFCGVMCFGSLLHAQDTPATQSPTQSPAQTQQSPTYPQQSPAQTQQTPDTSAPPAAQQPSGTPGQRGQTPSDSTAAPDPNGGQTFTGTVTQQGGKYVLQSENGTVYDIDHQDQVKKFEGKRVRVHGTLDASGKMIHIQ